MTQVYTPEELEKRKAWLRDGYERNKTAPKPHWYERELRYLATIQALQDPKPELKAHPPGCRCWSCT